MPAHGTMTTDLESCFYDQGGIMTMPETRSPPEPPTTPTSKPDASTAARTLGTAALRLAAIVSWLALDLAKMAVYVVRVELRESDIYWSRANQRDHKTAPRKIGPKPKRPKYKYLGRSRSQGRRSRS